MPEHALTLVAIALVAATVNGALGYGFSSITVPFALLFFTNRVLNPAIVVVEIALNAYVLWVNRTSIRAVWARVLPVVLGLAPGILVGTILITSVNPAWVKLGTFFALLPLILLQAAGFRRPISNERMGGTAFGSWLGAFYAVTTISGPPLALAFSNQGFVNGEFRAALAVVRLAESSLTTAAYLAGGLFSAESLSLIPYLIPCIACGVPVGALVIRRVQPETFRRICMSFDAWVVAFGCSRMLAELHLVTEPEAYLVVVTVATLDVLLLARYFSRAGQLASKVFTEGS